MKKIKKFLAAAVALLILFSAFLLWSNNSITVSNYKLSPANLPREFDGYRIVQVSDLHNKDFGGRLLEKIKEQNPDIIVITGDIIDSYHTDISVAARFVENAVKIAPVYYITGNHEHRIEEYGRLKADMEQTGAVILDGKTVTLSRSGAEISLTGIDDIDFFGSSIMNEHLISFKGKLRKLSVEKSENTAILLSHKPQYIWIYDELDYDLVFSGHAHGGQIRLPFIGGIYAPGQGFLPEYTQGIYTSGETEMVVSRGLGNSLFPFRIFNRPELVVCELIKEN